MPQSAEYENRLRQALDDLKKRKFTNVHIAQLTGVPVATVTDWRKGRRMTTTDNILRLEIAADIVDVIDANLGPGFGLRFLFLEMSGVTDTPAELLLRMKPPTPDILASLVKDFPDRVVREGITVSGRSRKRTAGVVSRGTGVPEADELMQSGFTLSQISRLLGVTPIGDPDLLRIVLASNRQRYSRRLKLAQAAYAGLAKSIGGQRARQLMYWEGPQLGLYGRSVAGYIGELGFSEARWPRNHADRIAAAIRWLSQNAANLPNRR